MKSCGRNKATLEALRQTENRLANENTSDNGANILQRQNRQR